MYNEYITSACVIINLLLHVWFSNKKKTQLKLAQSVKDECNVEVTVNVGVADKIQAVCCCANSGVMIMTVSIIE